MSDTTTDSQKAKAKRMTPKRFLEEAGHGIWGANLTDADKGALAAHLRHGWAARIWMI